MGICTLVRMNLALQSPLLLPGVLSGNQGPAPSWPFYPYGNVQTNPTESTRPQEHMSEREMKALRRKQANRESARRSKLRKKLEVEALSKRARDLQDEHEVLKRQVSEAKLRLNQLQSTNESLRDQINILEGKVGGF